MRERERERKREGERKREREKEGGREREKERERESELERVRKKEREKEGGRERERVRKRYIFLKGVTGALAPFSYLVSKSVFQCLTFQFQRLSCDSFRGRYHVSQDFIDRLGLESVLGKILKNFSLVIINFTAK